MSGRKGGWRELERLAVYPTGTIMLYSHLWNHHWLTICLAVTANRLLVQVPIQRGEKKTMPSLVGVPKQDVSHSGFLAASPVLACSLLKPTGTSPSRHTMKSQKRVCASRAACIPNPEFAKSNQIKSIQRFVCFRLPARRSGAECGVSTHTRIGGTISTGNKQGSVGCFLILKTPGADQKRTTG